MDIQAGAFFLALFSLASIWLFDRQIVIFGAMLLSLTLGFTLGVVDLYGLFILVLFVLLNYAFHNLQSGDLTKILFWVLILIIASALALNVLPGFEDWQIINGEFVSIDGERYSLYLNMDKILAGTVIGLWGFAPIRNFKYLVKILLKIAPIIAASVTVIATFGILSGLAKIDPKFPDIWLVWIIVNLVMHCITEELIFRYFLQGNLCRFMAGYKYAGLISILVSSFTYMLFNSSPSMMYMIGVLIGSIFIGYAYHITRRVEAAIVVHFTINLIHFFFFTYPILSYQ